MVIYNGWISVRSTHSRNALPSLWHLFSSVGFGCCPPMTGGLSLLNSLSVMSCRLVAKCHSPKGSQGNGSTQTVSPRVGRVGEKETQGEGGFGLDPKWHRVPAAYDIHFSTYTSFGTSRGYQYAQHTPEMPSLRSGIFFSSVGFGCCPPMTGGLSLLNSLSVMSCRLVAKCHSPKGKSGKCLPTLSVTSLSSLWGVGVTETAQAGAQRQTQLNKKLVKR